MVVQRSVIVLQDDQIWCDSSNETPSGLWLGADLWRFESCGNECVMHVTRQSVNSTSKVLSFSELWLPCHMVGGNRVMILMLIMWCVMCRDVICNIAWYSSDGVYSGKTALVAILFSSIRQWTLLCQGQGSWRSVGHLPRGMQQKWGRWSMISRGQAWPWACSTLMTPSGQGVDSLLGLLYSQHD